MHNTSKNPLMSFSLPNAPAGSPIPGQPGAPQAVLPMNPNISQIPPQAPNPQGAPAQGLPQTAPQAIPQGAPQAIPQSVPGVHSGIQVVGAGQPPHADVSKSAQQITPRFQSLLEQLKGEFVAISHEAELRGANKEADPKLIQQHMTDLTQIRRTIFDLHQAHQQLRDQYNEEVTRLRNKLDEVTPRPPIVGRQDEESSSVTANGNALPVQPLGGENSHVPGVVVPPSENNGDANASPQIAPAVAPPSPKIKDEGSQKSTPAFTPGQAPEATPSNAPGQSSAPVQPQVPAQAPVQAVPEQAPEATPSGNAPATHEGSGSTPQSTVANGAPVSPPQTASDSRHAPPVMLNTLNFDELPSKFKKEGPDYRVVYNPYIPRHFDVDELHTLPHSSVVCCVRFSHDGRHLATGCNHTAQIYDAETGELQARLRDPNADESKDLYIRSVCFSPDGRYLATGAEDNKVRVWDIEKRELAKVLQGHSQEIYSLAFSHNGKFLVSGGGDCFVKVWDSQTGAVAREFKMGDGVTSVDISADDQLIAAGSLDRKIMVWRVETGELVDTLGGPPDGHQDSVYSVSFMASGRELISGSLDHTAKVWELRPDGSTSTRDATSDTASDVSHVKMTIQGPSNYVLSVTVTPDSKYILSGSKDQCLHVWDAATGTVQLMVKAHTNSVISIAPSPRGSLIASGGGDSLAKVWRYKELE